jgi:hypothetical protein
VKKHESLVTKRVPARRLFSCFALRKFLRHPIVIRHFAGGVDDLIHPTNIAPESGGMMMAGTDSVKTNPRHKSW